MTSLDLFKPPQEIRELNLLQELEKNPVVSQRELSNKFGIALGVTNACLKRMARRGWIRVTAGLTHRRIGYYLTPKGFAEKAKLTVHLISWTMQHYSVLKDLISKGLLEMQNDGVERVVFYGVSDEMEIAYVTLQGVNLKLVGIVEDEDKINRKEVFGFEIIEGWGLTEAGANNSVNPLEGLKKVGSIGRPMKGTEMQIVDDAGKVLPPGQQGEIMIRGPMLMKGYWNKPEETAEILRDGWLHTGDVGYVDKDGYFWITDRKKDLIIKAGENISPRVIEEVLFKHPKISEAAVIGIKDEIYGENIKAFGVLKPGQTATAGEIIEYCQTKLPSFLVPKEVTFMPALPKSLVGKVLKKELRKL